MAYLRQSKTSLRANQAVLEGVLNGDEAAVRQWLPLSRLQKDDETWHNAFLTAVERNDVTIVDLILPFCDPALKSSLALSQAAERGYEAMVELLLPLSDPKADESRSLIVAIYGKHTAIAKRLLPYSDLTAKRGQPFYAAVDKNQVELVDLMLPLFDLTQDQNLAREVTQLAISNDHTAIFERLLPFLDVSATHNNLLRHAAEHRQHAMIDRLLPLCDLQATWAEEIRHPMASSWITFDSLSPYMPISDVQAVLRMKGAGDMPQASARVLLHELTQVLDAPDLAPSATLKPRPRI